jgi:methylisocitrate lyase
MADSPGRRLRDAVVEATIQVPGAPSALFGRLIERMGFQAAYLSGAAFSAGTLALPDIGFFNLSELADATRLLTAGVQIPVIVDADTGFGESVHLERTVFELERAGAAAIQIEDQAWPKRCGHLSGKSIVDVPVMEGRLRAAAGARADDDLILLARTDARGVTNLDDAIDRAKRYLDAGADWIFVEALTSSEEFQKVADEIDAPLVANMTEFGKSPLLSHQDLADMGYAAILYPVTLLRIAMKAAETALAVVATEGSQESMLDLMQTREELYDLLDYSDFEDRDRIHFGNQGEKHD